MLPFDFIARPGRPVSEQVVFAVKRALARGALRPGDAFPSVRVLSRELRINPNTAQKVLSTLTNAGILEIEPGIGARVAEPQALSTKEQGALLDEPLEGLCVEAKRIGLSRDELEARLRRTWQSLET
ncbi:MAG: GntR family transcriptional regulator [Opitutales bacterium]